MRPVSLKPVGPEGVQREKILTSGQITKNVLPLMLLNGKIFYIYFCRSF
jgi:hypothetical protein